MFLSRINRADDKPWEAQGERQFLLLSDRQKMNLEHRVRIACILPGKNSSPEISLSFALFVVFFFCRVWEKRVDVLGEKRLEIGTTRRNAWFSSPSQALPFMQDPRLSHDNVKCTHRLSLSSLREKYKQSSFRNIIRLFYCNFLEYLWIHFHLWIYVSV